MKLLLLILLVLSFNAFSGVVIVSDLDETIKISNSGSAIGAFLSSFKKSRTFSGIPEFFQGTSSYVDKVFVISASPTILRKKIKHALDVNEIKHDGIILKKWLQFENRHKYKVRMIKELMETNTEDFLLLGDDVGDDPEVYDEIKRSYPNRVIETYIHVIKNRKIPAGMVTHYTAHDLAILEHAAGRMSAENVQKVISRMGAEKQLKYVFPNFAHCPKTNAIWAYQLNTIFADLVFEMNNQLVSYCTRSKN